MKNPDYIATACEDGVFRIWKIMSGDLIRVMILLILGNKFCKFNYKLWS